MSFAPLILPSKADGDHLKSIDLPSVDPRSLQDLCRLLIRHILREIVNKEHPPVERERKPFRPSRPRVRSRITISSVNNMLELASEIMSELNDDEEDNADKEEDKRAEKTEEDKDVNDAEEASEKGKTKENDESITEELAECQISKGKKRAHENGSQDENGSKKLTEEKQIQVDELTNILHIFRENVAEEEEEEEDLVESGGKDKSNGMRKEDADESRMNEEDKIHDSDSESSSSLLSSSSASQESLEKIRLRLSKELSPSEQKPEPKKSADKGAAEPNYLRQKILTLPLPPAIIEYLLYYRTK